MNFTLIRAIQNKIVITFYYRGHLRFVEPHTYGVFKNSRQDALVGYQTLGGSNTGGIPAWRTFLINEIFNLDLSQNNFIKSRPGFRRDDPRMNVIYAQI